MGLEAVLVIPSEPVRTTQARAALPAAVPLEDAVFNVAHATRLVLGLAIGDWERSNEFYAAVLGAEVVRVGNGYAYRFGMNQLNVHGPGVDGEPNARPAVASSSPVASSGRHMHTARAIVVTAGVNDSMTTCRS